MDEETVTVTDPVIVRAITAHKKEIEKLRQQRDEFEEQRDAAWAELRKIRVAIGAKLEESTADEVAHIKQQRDELLSVMEDVLRWRTTDLWVTAQLNNAIAKCKEES